MFFVKVDIQVTAFFMGIEKSRSKSGIQDAQLFKE